MSEPGTGLMAFADGTGENPPGVALPMEPLVSDLLAGWDDGGVRYAVLRNGERLPTYTRYDIDVLVHPRDRNRALDILAATASDHAWQRIAGIRKRHYTCLLFRSPGAGACAGQYLPIDVFTGLEHRGCRFGVAEALLSRRRRTNLGVWVLPDGASAAITLLKELLPHGELKANSRDAVQRGAREDGEAFLAVARDVLPPRMARDLHEAAAGGTWDALAPLAGRVRRRLGRSPWRPLRYVHAAVANLANMRRAAPALVVVVMGPDGCGKTTAVRGAAARLLKRPFKCCRYQRGHFGLLPRLRDARARLTRCPAPAAPAPGTPHAGMIPPLPPWKSCLLATYYALDLVLGRVALHRWRSQWALVFFDRYFFDYYVQHGHRRAPRAWLDVLSRFIPAPDLIVHIRRSAEAIYASKPELTLVEIRRQQAAIENLLRRYPQAIELDGNRGIEATASELASRIETLVLERLRVA